MQLIQRFIDFTQKNTLFLPHQKILLAFSGGVDSVVLWDLMQKAGFDVYAAHCNFGLRGEESEGDEAYVRNIIPTNRLFVCRFDTVTLAKEMGVSIQIAARRLRYAWFEEIRNAHQIDYVATAHHANDHLETLLYNLTKGTGIAGLHGIRLKNGRLIRPLLFASKQEILDYAKENKLFWREDSSNAQEKYSRNLIRNKVIPLLKKINPSIEKTAFYTIERLAATEHILQNEIELFKEKYITKKQGKTIISLQNLLAHAEPTLLLYELLKPYGFNYKQAKQAILSTSKHLPTTFISKNFDLIKEKNSFIIIPKAVFDVGEQGAFLHEHDNFLKIDNVLYETKRFTPPLVLPLPKENAYFDASMLEFPLEWRTWKEGDKFHPFGMKGSKKVSDFLNDLKIPIHQKKTIKVLCSGENIIWVIGLRSDERFKVKATTSTIYSLEIVKTTNYDGF